MKLTAELVEKRIDQAGRNDVFLRAESLGWARGSTPPLWVWNQIALELIAGRAALQEGKE